MITSCGDSVQRKWTFIKKCCYWRTAVFADLVESWFVFSCSCLNSSFPVSAGIWQRQQNKKRDFKPERRKESLLTAAWCLLSALWPWPLRCMVSFKPSEYDRCPLKYISNQRCTEQLCVRVPFYLSYQSTIFSSIPALLMHSAFRDAWQMCAFEGGIKFLQGWKGGTGLEIATVGSWGPRHSERCCSNQGPSGGNKSQGHCRRRGEGKIQGKALLIGLVIGRFEKQSQFSSIYWFH